MSFPKKGDVYLVNLDPVVGSEIDKTRPAVIISNDVGNRFSPRVIVAPVSSKEVAKVYPFEARVEAGEGGLGSSSKVLLDQIRTADKRRLARRLGTLTPERMDQVNAAIRVSLAL